MGFFGKLLNAAKAAWDGVKRAVKVVGRAIGRAVSAAGEAIMEVGKTIVEAFSGDQSLTEAARQVAMKATKIWKKFTIKWTDIITDMSEELTQIWEKTERNIERALADDIATEVEVESSNIGIENEH